MSERALLEVEDLAVSFEAEAGRLTAVNGVSFSVARGRTLGLVGESGCGKSVTALSLMRLLPRPSSRIDRGAVRLDGVDLLALSREAMTRVRGRRVAMVFQEPMTALNPVHTVERQIGESLALHKPELGRDGIRRECLALLERVGIPEPARRLRQYPCELSGGMRQRVMIAIAIACGPDLLIADEPTTALDVTIQAQILALLQRLQRETGMAMVFITHDFGVVSEMCDEVAVMYAGRIVERAAAPAIFAAPTHPYTQGLLASIPQLATPRKTRLKTIDGVVPSLSELPPGCAFQNRCGRATAPCRESSPVLAPRGERHEVACFNATEAGR